MKDLLKSMQEKYLIGKNEHKYLCRNFGGITQEVFENELKHISATSEHGRQYTIEITVCHDITLLLTQGL